MSKKVQVHHLPLRSVLLIFVVLCLIAIAPVSFAQSDMQEIEKVEQEGKQFQQEIKAAATEQTPKKTSLTELSEDTSTKYDVSSITVTGNKLIATEVLLSNLPPVYDPSASKAGYAGQISIYDFSAIIEVLENPGQAKKISEITIKGFTQYLLNIYQQQGYGGIYIYVPAETFAEDMKLSNNTLLVKVLEASVGEIKGNFFNVNGLPAEKPYLKTDLIEKWSPIQPGEPVKKRELDNYLNLLNLNPDRYISASVSKGQQPDTLDVQYNVYEVNPWHYFMQIDNAGTKDRRWSPRLGLINTNLTGRDDNLTAVIQGPVDDRFSKHDYSAFVSYDAPLYSQRLRLNLFAGRSEFDVDGGGGIGFLGNGTSWGGTLTYNALQRNNWFFDVFSGLSFERSKVTPTGGIAVFGGTLGSEVDMTLWNVGAKIHRSDDLRKTVLSARRDQRVGGSGQRKYWDAIAGSGSRQNSEKDFHIWNLSASHYQFRNTDKIERLLGSVKFIIPSDRLVSSKMTTFGGMYTVRGYEESAIVADGGVLASLQYEYDLVKRDQALARTNNDPRQAKPNLRKLAPLAFFDYGRASTKDPVAGEHRTQELYSLGTGVLYEWGDHLSGAIYYGHPLKDASGTEKGHGRVNMFFMLQW